MSEIKGQLTKWEAERKRQQSRFNQAVSSAEHFRRIGNGQAVMLADRIALDAQRQLHVAQDAIVELNQELQGVSPVK